jgi:hypothetical protein
MRARPLRAAALCALALGGAPTRVFGQISPGPLSRPHAKLEGSGHCLDCHDPGQGVSPAKCLACHEPLQKRIAVQKGLHARPEYRDCRTCHVEHQGTDFELVYWGKAGRDAFDHSVTGHPLAGKHSRLACQECHRTRSYLGSPTDCASCHKDEHRGQFAGRACASCHSEQAWKPAPGFDHARTSWPLTGRHAAVGCDRCHSARRPDPKAPGATFPVFRVTAGRQCASCHQDTHQGRLGTSCATCHTTASWRADVKTANFDHARTAYPLNGRHAAVACASCHAPGRPLRVRHDRCTDCHADAHAGPAARGPGSQRCESCHDVSGFRPARFGVEEHARSGYPLAGAHLAVACDQCHRPVRAGSSTTVPLRFASTRCADCHRDPHRGELARLVSASGCEGCHRVDSWRQVAFDHSKTEYPLAGRHVAVACVACHRDAASAGATPAAALRFRGVPRTCDGCHRDPHQGQFPATGRPPACERCHTADTVQATKFDHSRDSAYPLDGAHARLACTACHRTESRGGVTFVRYKPLPVKCSGCHAGRLPGGSGGSR